MELLLTSIGIAGGIVALLANLTGVLRYLEERVGRSRPAGPPATPANRSDPGTVERSVPLPDGPILTPDRRLRVFVSSTLGELADERRAARAAIEELHLTPVMFELGARPHPPRALYRAYLEQSDLFVGIYGQRYGWVAPGETVSGLEDEYLLSGDRPKLIYLKTPAPEREPRLAALLDRIRADDRLSYRGFAGPDELGELLGNDLALLLTERFHQLPLADPGRRSGPPQPSTPLIGRLRELDELTALLALDEVRLVTLTGPGGIGKTRLALELAHRAAASYRDGVVVVPLASVRDPAHVASAVAQALGLTTDAPAEGLKLFLRDRHTLLVLDNFEHVIDAAPQLSDWLAAAPRLELVVTSRERLQLATERVVEVAPLGIPDTREPHERWTRADAMQLLLERAVAASPRFSPGPDDLEALAAICERLEGVPLALELAAAHLRTLTPATLLSRLEERLLLSSGGPRDLPSRQRTLRATIDWSFALLDPHERAVLQRLAVFVGGFSMSAVEAVCAEICDRPAETLAALFDKSLVRRTGTSGDDARFAMLETVREYALEKLVESGDDAAARRSHVAWLTQHCEALAPLLRTPDPSTALLELEGEHENTRAAMAFALASDDLASVARIGWALWMMWWIHAHTAEGHRWLQTAVARLDDADPPPLDDRFRARLFCAAAILAFWQRDLTRVVVLLDDARPRFRAHGDRAGEAVALLSLGATATSLGETDRAGGLLEAAHAAFVEVGDDWGATLATNSLARNLIHARDYLRAATMYAELATRLRERGDRFGLAICLNGRGTVALRQKRPGEALEHFSESLQIARDLGYLEGITWALEGFAVTAALQRRWNRSARLMAAAAALRDAIRFPPWTDTRVQMEAVKLELRARLRTTAFDQAWQEGASMTFDQATRYALDDLLPRVRTPAA